MWDYLQTPYLDKRFELIAPLIDVKNKSIVDLDGGTCRFINFIPSTFKNYYANDILGEYDPLNPRIDFQNISDTDMVRYLRDKEVDILAVFGHGAGHLLTHPAESCTLKDSFIHLIDDHLPHTLIIEGSKHYNDKYGMLDELAKLPLYEIKHTIHVPFDGSNVYSERFAYILERDS